MSNSETRYRSFVEKTKAFTDKHFPERQLVLRTDGDVKYFCISKRFQMSVSAGVLAFLTWSAFTSATHFMHDFELLAKDKEILSVQVAYRSLLSEVTEYQSKFTNISNELEANHSKLVASLDQNILENKDRLVSAEAARKEAQVARRQLNSQLHSIEESMRELANRNYSLKGDLSLKEMDLQTALAERNTARLQKQRIEEKLRAAEIKMAHLNQSQEELIKRVSDQASEEIAYIENILTIAGLDPDKMLSNMDQDTTASGGPFIAATGKASDEMPAPEEIQLNAIDRHLARWQGLQGIRQSLPLAQPLDYYYISSRYGKRRDPVNKRWAVHYGLDMAASKKSPVYVTAPGKVTFVGWKGNYGNFIMVDHGNGIETRYGHLHKTLVKKGDTVDYRTKIGLVGSTGRSTGAHLHYEVRVNGTNVDPFKFIKAGRNVFQG
ncbi:peptidase M23 [Terasakiella brassicae]|uniref:Peptidase M23 n=1 Tax=Terasakiella brassicae TaxID=1634917 RepID=A0A917BN36_9PROT|nr:M23 family metallopeptidase [Terasakiella brassicae]GGF52613.1 peptidase M23 [Terasakiella brassicae]